MKKHPSVVEGENSLRSHSGLAAFAAALIKDAQSDFQAMQPWLAEKRKYYERRYATSDNLGQVNFPWTNASALTVPMEDWHVEEMKAPIANVVFGGPRVYNMRPRNAAAVSNASASNLAMQDMLMNRMPDYEMQLFYGTDSWAQHGLVVWKVYYHYETRQTTETVRKSDLPQSLRSFSVQANITEEKQAIANQVGVTLITIEQFREQFDQIKARVMQEYDLHDDDEIDKVAIRQMMDFLSKPKQARVAIKRRAVVWDSPRQISVEIENIGVPQGTRSIETALRVSHKLFFHESDLRQRARDNSWYPDQTAEVIKLGPRPRIEAQASEMAMARRERSHTQTNVIRDNELFELWEIYCHWDIDGDGLDERCVLTVEPESGIVVKAIELPFDHGEWPFSAAFLEATDPSYFSSRGVPEKISDLARHVTALARTEMNNLAIEGSRSFTRVIGAGIPDELEWAPGLVIDVQQQGDFAPLDIRPTALVHEQPMRNYMALAERVVTGSRSPSIDSPEPERRTATQVNASSGREQNTLGVRARLFQTAQRRNGMLLWKTFRQFGPDKWFVDVTGQTPVKMTQAQIRGEFNVVPVGAVADMDPNFRFNRALQMLDINMKMSGALGDDPRGTPDLWTSWQDLLEENDPIAAARAMRKNDPETIQKIMEQRQQMAQRAQQIGDMAQRWQQNAGNTPEEALELLSEIKKQGAVWGDLQQLIDQSAQVTAGAQRSALLAGGQNGQ